MRFVISPGAESDLEGIGNYIARDNPSRAASYTRKIREYCRSLITFPRAHPLYEEYGKGIRRTVYGSYLIFYTATEDELRIERILHSARDINEDSFDTMH